MTKFHNLVELTSGWLVIAPVSNDLRTYIRRMGNKKTRVDDDDDDESTMTTTTTTAYRTLH